MTEIYACATHGVLSRPGRRAHRELGAARGRRHGHDPALPAAKQIPQLKVLSVAPLIGEAIKRIHRGESVGALFSSEVSFTQEMLLWEDGHGHGRRADSRRPTTTYHHRCPPSAGA